jgi:hypothetical protein
VTSEVERETLERDKKEMLATVEHLLADRSGFLEFMAEASMLLTA